MLYYPHNHPYFQDEHPAMLDEVVYSDILHAVDPRDLPYRDYAPLVKYVKYVGTKGNIMKFFVPSPTRINNWNTYVQFTQWDQVVQDNDLNAPDAARLLLWSSDLRFHCSCPAYLFWGMQYIDTMMDMAIVPETRYPSIRNPDLRGILCKHGIRTIKVLPFHLGDMAKMIRQQREQGSA